MNNFVILLLATHKTQSVDDFVRLSSSIAWRWWWNGGGNWNCETEKCDDCTRNFMQIFVTICVVFGVCGSRAKPVEGYGILTKSNYLLLPYSGVAFCVQTSIVEWMADTGRTGGRGSMNPPDRRKNVAKNNKWMNGDGTWWNWTF